MRRVNFRQFLDRAATTSHFQSPRLTDGAPSVVFADHLADCRERPVPAVEYRRNIHHQGAAKGILAVDRNRARLLHEYRLSHLHMVVARVPVVAVPVKGVHSG